MKRLPWRALLVGIALGIGPPEAFARQPSTPAPPAREATVERVVDGDTLLLVGRERVRLIGVDAPEIPHRGHPGERFGAEARDFTNALAGGRHVTLVFDAGAGIRDRYGRTLAYVLLPDGRNLNLEIIRAGWAEAYRSLRYARKREFQTAEREARNAGRGMWASSNEHSQTVPQRTPQGVLAVGLEPQPSGLEETFESGARHLELCRQQAVEA